MMNDLYKKFAFNLFLKNMQHQPFVECLTNTGWTGTTRIIPGRLRGLMVKIRQPTLTGILVNRMMLMATLLKDVLPRLLDTWECGLISIAHPRDRLFVKEISSLENIATVWKYLILSLRMDFNTIYNVFHYYILGNNIFIVKTVQDQFEIFYNFKKSFNKVETLK